MTAYNRMILFLLSIMPVFILTNNPVAESRALEIEVRVAASLNGVIWGLTTLDEQTLLATTREGKLWSVNPGTGVIREIAGMPKVHASGQGGLLDVAIPPEFPRDPWIYFTYSKPVGGGSATTLARGRLQDGKILEWQDLLVTRTVSDSTHHYGSRIAFDNEGYVFFSIGDRGDRDLAQDLNSHAGKVLRLLRNGQVPGDNPFSNQQEALAEIWSYGHRNPQGLFFDRTTQSLWVIEHGPRGGDEINRIVPGGNYGWPVVTYGREYWGPSIGEGSSKPGMVDPVKQFTPSIAPGALIVYQGSAFPEWRGALLATALKLTHLNVVKLNGNEQPISEDRFLENRRQRLRALLEGRNGWLYIGTDDGQLLEIKPANK